MNTSKAETFGNRSALIVGVGGLGCPAALALLEAGVGRLVLADDDVVDETNLHRQILFCDDDVGKDKLECAHAVLSRTRGTAQRIELVRSRLLPDNARLLVADVDVVVEGADNFATKFLAADAAKLEAKPVVHGAAVRWTGTAWAVGASARPCYRCLFEDLPPAAAAPNCAEAGVMGPVVGFLGALMADLALRVLSGDDTSNGHIFTYDGKRDLLREVAIPPRAGCPLCGAKQTIFDIEESRYMGESCAA
jgi:adenylyltransferase/sulfurtransferase